MGVKLRVFYPELRQLLGAAEVDLDGTTVGQCLNDLVQKYPGARELLFDSRGELFDRVYVFVNAEGMFKADLAQPVTDEDVLLLAVLASGG